MNEEDFVKNYITDILMRFEHRKKPEVIVPEFTTVELDSDYYELLVAIARDTHLDVSELIHQMLYFFGSFVGCLSSCKRSKAAADIIKERKEV